MKLSVILPVYNAEKYIDEAIESVLKQTYSDFELLLLNDGSTDDSLAKIKSYAAKDTRCKVYSWPNQGLIKTLNAGVELSIGEIVMRMDADDVCHPNRFMRQVEYLQAHPECVAVGTQVSLIDPEGRPIKNLYNPVSHDDIDAANITASLGAAMVHPTLAMRRNTLIDVGCYKEDYIHAEDIDLFLRLAEVGKLTNLDEYLLQYRQHLNSVGYKYSLSQHQSICKAIQDASVRRGISLANSSINSSVKPNISIFDFYNKWAWWALKAGNVETARYYGWRAVRENPFKVSNFLLIACLLRGK
jgi:glycosyltransferase involved in cell wall biosynthesis